MLSEVSTKTPSWGRRTVTSSRRICGWRRISSSATGVRPQGSQNEDALQGNARRAAGSIRCRRPPAPAAMSRKRPRYDRMPEDAAHSFASASPGRKETPMRRLFNLPVPMCSAIPWARLPAMMFAGHSLDAEYQPAPAPAATARAGTVPRLRRDQSLRSSMLEIVSGGHGFGKREDSMGFSSDSRRSAFTAKSCNAPSLAALTS